MAHEIFTNSWANAWQDELNRSESYEKAAQQWEWPMVLVMEADPDENIPEDRAIYTDLFHGKCREARVATADDIATVPYVITADPFTWREVMDGELEAIAGIMRGRLILSRGNMVVLARFVPAATELVQAAARIDSVFPQASV